jgi:hypothetical protein
LAALLGLATGPTDANLECIKTPLDVTVSERPNDDVQRPLAILSEGTTDWLFRPRGKRDLLGGQTIVGGDPTVGGVTLGNGSGLSFDRDCRGNRCVYTGLSRVAWPHACWNLSYEARYRAGDLVLGRNRVVIRSTGEGSEIRLVNLALAAPAKSLLLLKTASPIVGLNVSILSIHGGLRTFDVIRREAGGTLVLTTYVFDHKVVP